MSTFKSSATGNSPETSIYLNSLLNIVKNCIIVSYVDDIVLVFEGDTLRHVGERDKTSASVINNWLDFHKLFLSVKKHLI